MCFFVLLDRSFEDPRQLQAAARRRRGPRRLQAAGRPLERKRTPVRCKLAGVKPLMTASVCSLFIGQSEI